MWVIACCLVASLVVVACDLADSKPGTHIYVLNRASHSIELDSRVIGSGLSVDILVAHGDTDTFALVDTGGTYRLIISSLVAAGDPSRYEAAVNVYPDVVRGPFAVEYSPYIDAEVVAK
jgi:hypothetical protein